MNRDTAFHRRAPLPRRLWFILAAPLAWAIQFLLQGHASLVEIYWSRSAYPLLAKPLSRITGLFPFSLAELGTAGIILWILGRLIWLIIRAVKEPRGKRLIVFRNFVCNILVWLSIWYAWSTLFWNLNYQRESFAEIAGLSVQPSSLDELQDLCTQLVQDANALRTQVREDDKGVMRMNGDFRDFAQRAGTAYQTLATRFSFLGGVYGHPKPVLLSRVMSYTEIVGIFTVMTAEANVDVDIPQQAIPATTLHEMAHQRGIAREDEANFVSWLACRAHPDADIRYSGTYLALIHATNALYAKSPDRWQTVSAQYGEGLRRDIAAEQAYWKIFERVQVHKVVEKVNDAYLKINGQTDGVQSYGRMVDLLLAEYKADKMK